MTHDPLVSVIIIFLNEERFLQEAIESVLGQTYDNWELLLVDDGSTDQSTDIAQRFTRRYPNKMRYMEHNGHQNRGMSASRNLGVRVAKGKYVSYLDGDDVWLPNKLEEQVAILETHDGAAMVYGPLHEWYSWTGKPEDLRRDDLYGFGPKRVHPYADSLVKPPKLLALFLPQDRFIPGGILLKRDVLERVGGNEDAFLDSYSDAVTHVKICLTSPVFVSSKVWYKYRIHPDSFCRRARRTGKSSAPPKVYLNWVEQYLLAQGVTDPEVWHAMRKAKWRWMSRLFNFRFHVARTRGFAEKVARMLLPVSVFNWLRHRSKTPS